MTDNVKFRNWVGIGCVSLCLFACNSRRLLITENRLLEIENARLSEDLANCNTSPESDDFTTDVSLDVIETYLKRAQLPASQRKGPNTLVVPIEATNSEFQLMLQLFSQEKVLYIVANDYIQIDDVSSSQAMVLLLTDIATLNYELLLGKLQLHPSTGAVSLSTEINIDDGLGYQTFIAVVHHLNGTADARYPELMHTTHADTF